MIAPTPATAESRKLVALRHHEWREHHVRWRWLLDSLEGGDRYRHAAYGVDRRGYPVRNLVRHKREYPDPRETQGQFPGETEATDDDYSLRLTRTPVPTFVAEAISDHLDRIFAREVKRDGPDALKAWWADVDGKGTPLDAWLSGTLAPILLAEGCVDVLIDRPAAPAGESVKTKADEVRLGLDRCVASFILPENMVWWRLDEATGDYAECLVREAPECLPEAVAPGVDSNRYRHWTAEGSTLYNASGEVLGSHPHGYGRPPIVRLFVKRKPRCKNVGQPPYEGVAERQREYYNRDSELILSDTLHAHPLLQGPEDFIQSDGSVPIGPSWLLPMKKNSNGGTATYQGFSVVDFPHGAAESIRLNKQGLRDEVDRDAAMNKPAGTGGTGSGTVAQSGLSKGFDSQRLNGKLGGLADALTTAELALARLALLVLGDRSEATVTVAYSKQFGVDTVGDRAATMKLIHDTVANPSAAKTRGVTAAFLKDAVREVMSGCDDTTYAAWDAEIDAALPMMSQPQPATPAPAIGA